MNNYEDIIKFHNDAFVVDAHCDTVYLFELDTYCFKKKIKSVM